MAKVKEQSSAKQQEIDALRNEIAQLTEENHRLRQSNDTLIDALKSCHNDINSQVDVLMTLKKEMISYEVQLESMTAENVALKARMGRIENNPIGKVALQTYRNLRDLKADLNNAGKKNHAESAKSKTPATESAKQQIVKTLEKNHIGKVALKLFRNAKSIAKANTK